MQMNTMGELRWKLALQLGWMLIWTQLILLTDTFKPVNAADTRQMCSKLQSMLSYGKYQTLQISSNITYSPRVYAQNFLAYSSVDDLLIFIEPKHHVHVYSAQTLQRTMHFPTTDIVIATSCVSLSTDSGHDLFLIYETYTDDKLIQLRVCQVRFDLIKSVFQNNYCLETLIIPYPRPDLRIHGFTIKRDHAGTNNSLLFISTEMGLIYTIFDTRSGTLLSEIMMFNETLNQGSVALSSAGSIYYANRQEHLLYELHITRDFHLRYGKTIQTKAIKSPFGLITDECNHLYIATRSMILIMYVQTYATIRSVFSKASDLPITLERLNSTTYVYVTMKKQPGNQPSYWMFNFLYFTNPERNFPSTRHPAVSWKEKLDFNDTNADGAHIPTLWPIRQSPSSSSPTTANTTKMFTYLTKTSRRPTSPPLQNISETTHATTTFGVNISSNDEEDLSPEQEPDEEYPIEPSEEGSADPQKRPDQSVDREAGSDITSTRQPPLNPRLSTKPPNDKDEDQNKPQSDRSTSTDPSKTSSLPLNPTGDSSREEDPSLNHDDHSDRRSTTRRPRDPDFSEPMTESEEKLLAEETIRDYFDGRGTFSPTQEARIQAFLARQAASNHSVLAKYFKPTRKPDGSTASEEETDDDPSQDMTGVNFTEEEVRSYLQGRSNFTTEQRKQMQNFLSQQLASDPKILSKFLATTTTKTPAEPSVITDRSSAIDFSKPEITSSPGDVSPQNDPTKPLPLDFDEMIDSAEIPVSKDELRAHLEGRSNLTRDQVTQIQAYLEKQPSVNADLLSRLTTTTATTALPGHRRPPDLHPQKNGSILDGGQDREHALTRPPINPEQVTSSEEKLIAEETIRDYFDGRGNFSATQEARIQAFVARQAAINHSVLAKYFKPTRKPDGSTASDEEADDDPSPDMTGVNFSEDEVRSYFQGRSNLTTEQRKQMQNFLSQQLSSDPKILSKFLTTKAPTRAPPSINAAPSDSQGDDEDSPKRSPSDSDDRSSMTKLPDVTFSDKEIESYLQGRANLSATEEKQIHAFLAEQAATNHSVLAKYFKSTRKPDGSTASGEEADDDPSQDMTGVNFSEDEVRSYLQGRSNFTTEQRKQMQNFLSRQLSSDPKMFSKYLTTTTNKASTRAPSLIDSGPSDPQGDDEDSTKEPPSDSDGTSRTTKLPDVTFSDKEIESYLQGRANLSATEEKQIQAFLAKKSSPSHHRSSESSTITTRPAKAGASDGDVQADSAEESHPSTDRNAPSRERTFKSPLFGLNLTGPLTDSEEVLLLDDKIRSYLSKQTNLTESEQKRLQHFLDKHSLDADTFAQYFAHPEKVSTTSSTTFDNLDDQPKDQSQSTSTSKTSPRGRHRSSVKPPFESALNQSEVIGDTYDDIYDDMDEEKDPSVTEADGRSRFSTPSTFFDRLHSSSIAGPVKHPETSDDDQSEYDDGSSSARSRSTKASSNYSSTSASSSLFDSDRAPDEKLTNAVTRRPDRFPSNNSSRYSQDVDALATTNPSILSSSTESDTDAVDDDDYDGSVSRSVSRKFKSTPDPRYPHASASTSTGQLPLNRTSQPGAEHSSLVETDQFANQTDPNLAKNKTTLIPSKIVNGTSFDKITSSANASHPMDGSKRPDGAMEDVHHPSKTVFRATSPSTSGARENKLSHEYSSSTLVNVHRFSTSPSLSRSSVSSTPFTPSSRSRTSPSLHKSTRKPPKTPRLPSSKFFSDPSTMPSSTLELTSAIDARTSGSSSSHSSTFKRPMDSTRAGIFDQEDVTSRSSAHPEVTSAIASTTESIPDDSSTRKAPRDSTKQPLLSSPRGDQLASTTALNDIDRTTTADKSSMQPTSREDAVGLQDPQSSTRTDSRRISSSTSSSLNLSPTRYSPWSTLKPSSTQSNPPLQDPTTSQPPIVTSSTIIPRSRSRRPKIVRWQTSFTTSSTTSIIPVDRTTTTSIILTTSILTSSSVVYPVFQPPTVSIPSLLQTNISNTLLSNDLFNQLMQSYNSSGTAERLLVFNLTSLPPSSWNISFHTNETVRLEIALPSPLHHNEITNLTLTNIEANQFRGTILGIPVHLQVDRVQAKEFALTMNATDGSLSPNRTNRYSSDVIIGHVRSEQFELNLTKTDDMRVYVEKVDSETAELYLDSQFCTNESSLQINLNLSKNGTIRYGNRTPIHIGPVFTRVHMLQHSCDREQPLTLFFDICEGQNPCLNDGTCVSVMPDYNDPSYPYHEVAHIGYRCACPLHITGEHCQYLQYPLGYCLNGGTLIQVKVTNNQSTEQCLCPPGFRGHHCEENIDDCVNVDCSNRGFCEDGIETHKCSCFDGYYGENCERATVETVLIKVVRRSFGIVAILLIISICGLVVASDIHTYMTRKQQQRSVLNQIPRVTSELFENSVLLLGFSDAPIEMNDLSAIAGRRKPTRVRPRVNKSAGRSRRRAGYRQISGRKALNKT